MTEIKYENQRAKIRTGDLFFTSSDSFFSRIIRFFTNSKVSHVGMFFWTKWAGEDRLMCVEYITSGFRTTFASSYILESERDKTTMYFGVLPEELKIKGYKIQKAIAQNSGGQYDTAGALVSLFRQNPNKNFYCSEFVSDVLGLKKNTSKSGFTPDDLANLCVEFKKIV